MSNIGTLFITELFGTALLIILGNGIVANVVLKNTKGNNAGWLSITIGWGFAVTVAALISGFSGKESPAWLNPAVTVGVAISGWDGLLAIFNVETGAMVGLVIGIIAIQVVGAMLGQIVVDLVYYQNILATLNNKEDFVVSQANVLGMHATGPANGNKEKLTKFLNFAMEVVATMVLVLGILAVGKYASGAVFGPIIVGIIVIAIGLSLGGTTGYAINPARDLGPRLVHQLLPKKLFANKGNSDWSYGWIPVVVPLVGGMIAGLIGMVW